MTKATITLLILMPILMIFSGSIARAEEGGASAGPESYDLLFIGNSHSRVNDLPGLVATLIRTGLPGKTVNAEAAPGLGFLSDRLSDGITEELLTSRSWTHVILQAQKYSSSGQYTYSTEAAEVWIRMAKEQNAHPVLFPEWGRKGRIFEGVRVHNLHLEISSRESACVAPIGLAWDESIARYPDLNLHANDGNHSNLTGALLTAFVFYELFTGQLASDLPYVPEISVAAGIQQDLRGVASFVVAANSETCNELATSAGTANPGDPAIPTLHHWGLVFLVLLMVAFGGFSLKRKPT